MTLERAWRDLVTWCRTNAPRTHEFLQPPAGAAEVSAIERRFPRRWPEDLRRWYELQNGASWECANTPLPDWRILSLAEMVEQAEMYADFYGEEDDVVVTAEHDSAGAITFAFIPSFVPIGDNVAACCLFVDTRPGPLFGCVSDWDRDEGALDEPTWPSVTAMLEDVVRTVRLGGTCNGWDPTVVDGELTWALAEVVPDAWSAVRDLYLHWRDLDYQRGERQPPLYVQGRNWNWAAVDLVENVVANYGFHQQVPLDEWPDEDAARLRRGVADLRVALPNMPSEVRPYFEITAELADATLVAAEQANR